jgi:hypothetical protein
MTTARGAGDDDARGAVPGRDGGRAEEDVVPRPLEAMAAAVVPLVPSFPFDRNRFRHDLVQQTGRVCLVARTNLVTGGLHWEVVVLQHERATTWHERAIPEHLRYPGNEEWGTAGWSYTSRTDAELRMRFLLESPDDHSRDAWESSWPRHSRTRPG